MYRLAAFSWGAKLLTALFNFASIVLLSQLLGEADRGVCALYAMLIALILLLADMAGGATVVYLMQYHSAHFLRHVYIRWAAVVALLVGSVAGLVAALSISETLLIITAGFLNALFSFQGHMLLGKKRFTAYNVSVICAAAGIVLLTALLLCWHLGSTGYLLAMNVVWAVAVVIQHFTVLQSSAQAMAVEKEVGWRQIFREMMKLGGVNQLVHLVGLVNNRLPFFLLPATLLGTFSNSMALAEALLLLPGSLGQIFYSQHAGQIPDKHLYRKFYRLLWVVLVAMGLAVVVITWLPASLYTWLFGAAFNGVGKLLLPLSVGMILYGIYITLSYWQSSFGKFYNNLWCILVAFIVTALSASYFYVVEQAITQIQLAACMAIGLSFAGITAILLFVKAWRRSLMNQP